MNARLRSAFAPRRASSWLEVWRAWWREPIRVLTLADAARLAQTASARLLCRLTGHGPTVDDHERGRPVYRCLRCFHVRPRALPLRAFRKDGDV
jgi:hypothetical protein